MTAVEPFKVNASGPTDIAKSLGDVAESFGKMIGKRVDAKRAAATREGNLRDAVAIHRAQMEHEANMQQRDHEHTLDVIDRTTDAHKQITEHEHELSGQAQDRYVAHAKSLLGEVQPGTQAEFSFGGGSFKGVSAVPARVEDDTAIQAARDRAAARIADNGSRPRTAAVGPASMGAPAMPRTDSARAARLTAKVASNVNSRVQFPTAAPVAEPAPVASEPAPKKPKAKKADTTTMNSLKPGEQYGD